MSVQELSPPSVQSGEWDVDAISRRRFLEASVIALSGVTALTVAGVGGRFLVGSAFESQPASWVQVGVASDLPAGKVHRASYGRKIKDAWRKTEQKGVLYVFSEDGVNYTALDGTCSHLGCVVHWQESENHFACPCHSGHFQRDGEVLDGPPPQPLRLLATKLEEGVLWVEV